MAEGETRQPAGAADPADPADPSVEELISQIRSLEVAQFLLSTLSTLASLTYAKLEAKALDQARTGIEALAALVPVLEGQIEAETARDLRAVLANLQLAYADAAASG